MNEEEKWQELLVAARANGPVALLVVELHAPSAVSSFIRGPARCTGCFGTCQGMEAVWPEDCETTQVVARALGVTL